MELEEQHIDKLVEVYEEELFDIDSFMSEVTKFFAKHPMVKSSVHSIKSRTKDTGHLREKIIRKWDVDDPIDTENFFERITDLAGVRVLLLKQNDFKEVHSSIMKRVEKGEWTLFEPPKAYTWDPEYKDFFNSIDKVTLGEKESGYTSVHYVIRKYPDSKILCEIQVRTLFEEIWGEVDHIINYPVKTESQSCKDQIMVLAKLVGAGNRLVDSVFAQKDLEVSKEP